MYPDMCHSVEFCTFYWFQLFLLLQCIDDEMNRWVHQGERKICHHWRRPRYCVCRSEIELHFWLFDLYFDRNSQFKFSFNWLYIELIPGIEQAYNDRHPKPPTPIHPPTPPPPKEPTPPGNYHTTFLHSWISLSNTIQSLVSYDCHIKSQNESLNAKRRFDFLFSQNSFQNYTPKVLSDQSLNIHLTTNQLTWHRVRAIEVH